jgi:hypothetical protein
MQPSVGPSSQPTTQPTVNRMHCLASERKFYSFAENSCIPCPLHSFLNHTGDDTCYCNAGYSQTDFGLHLNCTLCPLGEVSIPGDHNCTECSAGTFADPLTHSCSFCPVNFFSGSTGQTDCRPCPAGRTTVSVGSTSVNQCISPVPNFTLGFFALFLVVVIFSWYIVFGKFHRVSFERRTKAVEPNIVKCRELLLGEEECHYRHLVSVQEKRNRQNKKCKFIPFVFISVLLVIFSAVASFIFFTYQVFFTSLILWRGMKVDFKLSPILQVLAEALQGITRYIGFPVDIIFILSLPFFYLFDALDSINLNLSSVNITCSGSQAPIELLINCVILGFLIIVVRSDYQLLFNVLLNNVNQRFLLNKVEQQLEKGTFWFSRYFFMGLLFTAFIMINPFHVALRYCMGFVRLDSFAKNHKVAHEVSESCDQVPGAKYFDSFLGYTSTIFAWWLILPALYCLAEVVVPKSRKTDPLNKVNGVKGFSKKKRFSKVVPAEELIAEPVWGKLSNPSSPSPSGVFTNEEKDEENSLPMSENVGDEQMTITENYEIEGIRRAEVPSHITAKFPNVDEDDLLRMYQEAFKDGAKMERAKQRSFLIQTAIDEEEEVEEKKPSFVRKSMQKVTKKMPFLLAVYYYCKENAFLLVSVDLWIFNAFASWIHFLQKDAPLQKAKKSPNHFRAEDNKHPNPASNSSDYCGLENSKHKQISVFNRMYLSNQAEITKQKTLEFLWEQEQRQNRHSLPSYYELSHAVQEELHEFVIYPFTSILAFVGIGHFLTFTGRYYWNVVFHNYKTFLFVCLGIWTDEAVEAYGLEERSARLSVDDRAFLKQKQDNHYIRQKEKEPSMKVHDDNKNGSSKLPRGRKFSAQVLGFTITQADVNNNGGEQQKPQQNTGYKTKQLDKHQKQNMREVLPAIISVLICSRVILFQIVPSLVLFATISMTLASFPLFIFSEFLAETLPPLIVWGEVNREMSIERELKSFVPLHSTNQVLSERETIRVLTEEYSWRLSLRGTILFWNESRLLQFVHSSLALFFSFLLLIYTKELLIYLLVILALLVPFVLSRSLVLLLYLGNSFDLKDKDFPRWLRGTNKMNQNTARVEPAEQELSNEEESFADDQEHYFADEQEHYFADEQEQYFAGEKEEYFTDYNNNNSYVGENWNTEFPEDEAPGNFGSIDLDEDIEHSWVLSSSNTEEQVEYNRYN